MGFNEKLWADLKRYTQKTDDILSQFKTDFIGTNSDQREWAGSAQNTGSVFTTIAIDAKHPGVVTYVSHASNANSGYKYLSSADGILVGGGYKTTFVFRTATTLTGVLRRMGFFDTASELDPVDGMYAKISNGVISGEVTSNSTPSSTASTYNLTATTWYRLVIELNTSGTIATYTLYSDDSETVLWTNTINTNIPTGAGRFLRHGDICTLATSTGAIQIGSIDYVDVTFNNARRLL